MWCENSAFSRGAWRRQSRVEVMMRVQIEEERRGRSEARD